MSTATTAAEFSGDEHLVSLKPLLVTVCFAGAVPRQLSYPQIPIEISVSLAEEHRSFIIPVIDIMTWDASCYSGRQESSVLDDMSIVMEQPDDCDPHVTVSVPFLPLPPGFNFAEPLDWHLLSMEIEKWLTSDVSMPSKDWAWGCDMFWFAFVATYLAFPRGKWRMWSSKIMPVGDFIEAWLAGSHIMQVGDVPLTSERRVQVREYILNEFCRHAALVYINPFHIPDNL